MTRRKGERNKVSLAAEAVFRERLKELGAELLEPVWLGSHAKHKVRCHRGHECYPRPGDIRRGLGPCRTCAGCDPAAAWAAFRKRLEELGAELLETEWLGNNRPHRARCPKGHDCRPMPASVQQGQGICGACAGNSTAAAELAFRARLAEYGAELLEPYRGNKTRVHVRCAAGHDGYPWPCHILKGGGPCRICAHKDPVSREAEFLAHLADLGAVPLYTKYRGALKPHHVRCACGNESYPRPADVKQGDGICMKCAGRSHDVFYVLQHETEPIVKFGISSREGRRRLYDHRADGFPTVHLLTDDLAGDVAAETEKAVLATLALVNAKPLRGREYFDVSYLALILDVATGWLGLTDAAV